jgi:hypothetical protein
LKVELLSFAGHATNTKVISPFNPKEIFIDGSKITTGIIINKKDNVYILTIDSKQARSSEVIEIEY